MSIEEERPFAEPRLGFEDSESTSRGSAYDEDDPDVLPVHC